MKKLTLLLCLAMLLQLCACGTTLLPTEADSFVRDCIMEHGHTDETDSRCAVENHIVLKYKESGDTLTAYMWVLYQEYSLKDGELYEECGAHIPTAITITKTDAGWVLDEYWEPRDGEFYESDLKAKFPLSVRLGGLDSQKYIDEQLMSCRTMAELDLSGAGIDAEIAP